MDILNINEDGDISIGVVKNNPSQIKCTYSKKNINKGDYYIRIGEEYILKKEKDNLIEKLLSKSCKNAKLKKRYSKSLPNEKIKFKDSEFKRERINNNIKISLSNCNSKCVECGEMVIMSKKCLSIGKEKIHDSCITDFLETIQLTKQEEAQLTITKI